MSKTFRILATLAIAYVLSYGLRTINAVMAPTLKAELGISDGDLGLLSSMYFIAFCLMQIPLGPLLDKYGTRLIESALLLIAALGALIFAISESFWGLLIARFLIGAGVSACLMGAFKIFREQFELGKQGVLAMFMLFFGTLGALLSTAPTQILLDEFGWRVIFIGISGFLFIAAVLIFTQLPELKHKIEEKSSYFSLKAYIPIFKAPIFWQSIPVIFNNGREFFSNAKLMVWSLVY